jgi:hypothetical protein
VRIYWKIGGWWNQDSPVSAKYAVSYHLIHRDLPSVVQIEVNDLADVLCLAKGITPESLQALKQPRNSAGSVFRSMASMLPSWINLFPERPISEVDGALHNPAVVPPRKELGIGTS